MSRDRSLLHQLYLHDAPSLVWLFERSEEPLMVMVANEQRHLIYANEVAYWAVGPGRVVPSSKVHLEAVEGGFLAEMIRRTMTPRAKDVAVTRTLKTVLEEEWSVLVALTTFNGDRAAAIVVGRRSLVKRDLATQTAHAAPPSSVIDRLLDQIGLAWTRTEPTVPK
jgi:hypothetical protein